MKNRLNKYLKFFLPLYILVLFPFPSKSLGYSIALWLNDFVLIGYLLIQIFHNKFCLPRTRTFSLLLGFLFLNFMGILSSMLMGNLTTVRVITEIVRSLEYIIIYVYFYNVFRIIHSKSGDIEALLVKHLQIILLAVFSITVIELFNLPGKELLRNLYEMGKSGNIYQYYNRIVGTLRNPNFYGLWLSIIAIFVYLTRIKALHKLILLLISMIFLYFTGSRTSLVGFVITIVIVAILQMIKSRRNIKLPLVILLLSLASFYLLSNNYQDLFYSVRLRVGIEELHSLGGRVEIWNRYFDEILASPIIGVGIQKSNDLIFDNTYVQYAYYYGFVGLLFLMTFIIRNFFRNIVIYFRTKPVDNLQLFFLGVQLIVIISTFTVQIFDVLQISLFYFMGLSYLDLSKNKLLNNESR